MKSWAKHKEILEKYGELLVAENTVLKQPEIKTIMNQKL
jgi:hypothetical protein